MARISGRSVRFLRGRQPSRRRSAGPGWTAGCGLRSRDHRAGGGAVRVSRPADHVHGRKQRSQSVCAAGAGGRNSGAVRPRGTFSARTHHGGVRNKSTTIRPSRIGGACLAGAALFLRSPVRRSLRGQTRRRSCPTRSKTMGTRGSALRRIVRLVLRGRAVTRTDRLRARRPRAQRGQRVHDAGRSCGVRGCPEGVATPCFSSSGRSRR